MAKTVEHVELSKCKPGTLVEIQTEVYGPAGSEIHWVSLVDGWSMKDGVVLGVQITSSPHSPRSNLSPIENQVKSVIEVKSEWWYVVRSQRITRRVTGIRIH